MTSLAAKSVSPVCNVRTIGLSSAVAVCFNFNPTSASCVTVISESAPKDKTAASEINRKSSPTDKSAAIPAPPAAISEPVVALVEAVVATIFTCKFSSILIAGVVPTVDPNPINKSSAESSRAI